MGKILIVIDMQNDFVTGALGSEEAKKIVPAVVDKVKKTEMSFLQEIHMERIIYRHRKERISLYLTV